MDFVVIEKHKNSSTGLHLINVNSSKIDSDIFDLVYKKKLPLLNKDLLSSQTE